MKKESLEEIGFNGRLIIYEKKKYSPWRYDSNETRRDFLEGSLNFLKYNPSILEKVSFDKEYCGSYVISGIYIKISEFSKNFEVKSSLEFPVKGKSIIPLIERYLSGDILIRTNYSCFPDNFYIKINNFGSVKYHIGMFADSLLFSGVGNLDLDPQENIEKLKKYYKRIK
ncbi:MAG: hypothetical protein WC812_00460 [Candidatus Pacearchaeota archaeon]|jgi:hypothetical protein